MSPAACTGSPHWQAFAFAVAFWGLVVASFFFMDWRWKRGLRPRGDAP